MEGWLLQRLDITFGDVLTAIAGYSRKALKTLARLDYEKINNDLIEYLIEWIMEGKHDVGGMWIIDDRYRVGGMWIM